MLKAVAAAGRFSQPGALRRRAVTSEFEWVYMLDLLRGSGDTGHKLAILGARSSKVGRPNQTPVCNLRSKLSKPSSEPLNPI